MIRTIGKLIDGSCLFCKSLTKRFNFRCTKNQAAYIESIINHVKLLLLLRATVSLVLRGDLPEPASHLLLQEEDQTK
jgi:hypothetical protein